RWSKGIPPRRLTRLPLRIARGHGPRSVEIWLCDRAQDRQRRDRTVRVPRARGFRPACRNRLQHLARLQGKGFRHRSCEGPWSILRQVAAGSEPFARTPFRKLMLPRASSKNADLEKPERYSIQKITWSGAGKNPRQDRYQTNDETP